MGGAAPELCGCPAPAAGEARREGGRVLREPAIGRGEGRRGGDRLRLRVGTDYGWHTPVAGTHVSPRSQFRMKKS